MGKGSILEGKSLEIGGLMQQDTSGDIEHLRKKTTNQQDDGVDYERVVNPNTNYFEYMRNLKKGKTDG
ncbi:hypothetical protein NB550_22085 [Vibrio parahaemolyticus]|uniref:hypothetical protein n=2 Tax=Vibrio parahaemolyticus TaxID=670 RepID=UPI0012E130D5|nr:hypothetical protein [Vibrio parahaemolyticus]EGR0065754.1 hypothetical protein [Vibrio parahaemolyticus]EGR3322418.1 hypothetical protein [Vibrio parahaemolyticus]EKH9208964.1 hypothetical protein [Vibrio parahaemolyticus]MBY4651760.1 hypothetical protein [Vibrio parahaemolyticus]MCR9765612.1 hypothetical protein [Vibrio parahaemolyticus]